MTDQKVYTLTLPAGMVEGICHAVAKAPWEWAAPIMNAVRTQVAQQDHPPPTDEEREQAFRDRAKGVPLSAVEAAE